VPQSSLIQDVVEDPAVDDVAAPGAVVVVESPGATVVDVVVVEVDVDSVDVVAAGRVVVVRRAGTTVVLGRNEVVVVALIGAGTNTGVCGRTCSYNTHVATNATISTTVECRTRRPKGSLRCRRIRGTVV